VNARPQSYRGFDPVWRRPDVDLSKGIRTAAPKRRHRSESDRSRASAAWPFASTAVGYHSRARGARCVLGWDEHAIRTRRTLITRRVPNPISRSAVTASVYRKAAGLLGVSHDVSARLTDQTGRHVATILSSTTVHVANPESVTKIRQKLGGGPIIGHVGALYDHHKGQSVLIQAFHKLLADYPNARLLLVGEGPDRIHFQHLAKGDRAYYSQGSRGYRGRGSPRWTSLISVAAKKVGIFCHGCHGTWGPSLRPPREDCRKLSGGHGAGMTVTIMTQKIGIAHSFNSFR